MHLLTDGGLRLDFHNFRLLQKVMCKLLYFLWQCCGEHADRRVFWKTKEYLLDSFDKPHIQHFIRFIDNDIADFFCSKGSLLQMVKRIVPPMSNEIITLVKDTSLAFVLGMAEMFSVAKALAASNVSMIPYAIAALIYWVFCLFIEFILGRVEKKLAYYHD